MHQSSRSSAHSDAETVFYADLCVSAHRAMEGTVGGHQDAGVPE